jgi:hypothetical protein
MKSSKIRQIKRLHFFVFLSSLTILAGQTITAAPISEATEFCIDCHASVTPGIVTDWQQSRHSMITPQEGMLKPDLEKRISATSIPDSLLGFVVGCAECHTLSPGTHGDTFEHADYQVHTVVTPEDCAMCHPVEREEYAENLMANAHANLTENALYQSLAKEINGIQSFTDMHLQTDESGGATTETSCLKCHGTRVTVEGFAPRETELGEMVFPVLSGWPNQGVGRINPDNSVGSCTSCHPRHNFSIEIARKPYTCSECHKGPDVPAYKIYQVSKHGNIFSSLGDNWEFNNVPWILGEDFTAPTCAVCHISLIVDNEGTVIAKRSHQMNDRLDKRLFGLIYAHPHPISANTTIIRNAAGLPLPTELTGEPVDDFLIDKDEQIVRRERMKNICRGCHSRQWTDNHFVYLDSTIETTNRMTLTATQILGEIWNSGLAKGLPQGESIFDDAIEKKWVEQWLFYSNSIRMSAAMGGADYGVFANGRWYLSKNIREMQDWMHIRSGK